MTTPCGYQQITNVAASVGLTIPTLANSTTGAVQAPTYCRVIPQTQAVRWRDDGVAPTAAVGMPLAVGAELRYDGDLSKIRFFEQAASAALNINFYY